MRVSKCSVKCSWKCCFGIRCFFLISRARLWRFDSALVLVELAYLVVTSVFCDSMLKVLVWMEVAPQIGCVSRGKRLAENSRSMSWL